MEDVDTSVEWHPESFVRFVENRVQELDRMVMAGMPRAYEAECRPLRRLLIRIRNKQPSAILAVMQFERGEIDWHGLLKIRG